MMLLALGAETGGAPGPKGQVRKFMFPTLLLGAWMGSSQLATVEGFSLCGLTLPSFTNVGRF